MHQPGNDERQHPVSVRVFLVEDMVHMQGIVSDLLAGVGDFRLVGASATEAEAKLWLTEHVGAWDLSIIDLVLDQGSGMGVVAHARQTSPDSGKVVVFSDYASDGIRDHCLRLGADAVFMKSQMQEFMEYCAELGGLEAAAAP
jgi:DNA-binding NarL/FixJ family response regulator